ncbi:RNA polymerase sigma factor [Sporolactobacillus pectinivorans]|uniref:RNA polymerase sigma factor n=1 Tax=Sporolactobacillus pectinivorans TaxID=1591408 RepID=UPI000C257A6C|nr:sigma-70 family RNA polymerase sigma factor [Sporolactobacillus pectinivorans]
MDALQQKSDSQFETVFKPYIALMRRYCALLTSSSWDGDDLFQISMIRLYSAWRKKTDRPITKAYLYRIISSAWIDGHRKVSVDETVKSSFEDHPSSVAAEINEDVLAQGVKRLVKLLTPKQSLVFMMLAGWEMTPAEVAEQTGETEGNVRVIYHRARKKLRDSGKKAAYGKADQRALRYADAFQSGDPERLLRLYWEETGAQHQAMRMAGGLRNYLSGSIYRHSGTIRDAA